MIGMIGARRPTRVDKRVVKPLLDIVDHPLLVVTQGVGERTDPRSRLNDFIHVVATDCRGNVHFQQVNDGRWSSSDIEISASGWASASLARQRRQIGPSLRTFRCRRHSSPPHTRQIPQLRESSSALRTCEGYDIHSADVPIRVRITPTNEPRAGDFQRRVGSIRLLARG